MSKESKGTHHLTDQEWRYQLEAIEMERDQWRRYGEVWEKRYRKLVMEPLPTLIYRRLLVFLLSLRRHK